jgi:hypothetical protein
MIKISVISTTLVVLLLAGTSAGSQSTPNPGSDPVPDIRIDGHSGPLTVPHTQVVLITCSLDPGTQTGTFCRMWVVARLKGTGMFWLLSPGNWSLSPTPLVAHQGPLTGFNDFVLDQRNLPLGEWEFTFAVATAQGFWFDTLSISSCHGLDYRYDDGSCENMLGLAGGGDLCWMHRFDAVAGGELICSVQTIFGSKLFYGHSPSNGTPCEVFVWDDPTDDGDPSDCVLLSREPTVVQNVDTDIMNVIPLSKPTVVQGEFYIGCCMPHGAGQFAVPMDTDTLPYIWGNAWYCGTNTTGGFSPGDLMLNQYPPAEFGWYWCIRGGY